MNYRAAAHDRQHRDYNPGGEHVNSYERPNQFTFNNRVHAGECKRCKGAFTGPPNKKYCDECRKAMGRP